jgi:hypothetical protein
MFGLLVLAESATLIHEPFNLNEGDVGGQLKASSAGEIANTTA